MPLRSRIATRRRERTHEATGHFEREIILWGVRWYVAYPISYRQLEEMMEERGVRGIISSPPIPIG
jgi:transposase-like protein